MRFSAGYTLIELLIVISIISILSVVGFVNFKDFSSDQITIKAVGQIQTLFRLAQSNATSSALCNNQGALSWFLKFINSTTIELRCNPGDFLQKSYTLENVQVVISGSGCLLSAPVVLSYPVGTGRLSEACTSVTFAVSNTKNTSSPTKTFNISRGGAIDVR